MKRSVMVGLMMLFIYTLTFDIFLNRFFRVPTPIISCIPLIFFFRDKTVGFLYRQEIIIFAVSLLLYYVFGSNNLDAFSVNLFTLSTCALYFNFFVGNNQKRLNYSVLFFFLFLLFSTVVMLLNQFNGNVVNNLRSTLIGAPIRQSPSGIASTIFNFGYQLAPIVTFLVIYACTLKKNSLLIMGLVLFSIISIYLGLQRSVLVAFLGSCFIFSLVYYKFKSIIIISVALLAGFFLYNYAEVTTNFGQDNILAKNERTDGVGSRTGLVTENFKIIADYPFGLIFHGQTWNDVSKRNSAFRGGLTSHNAYLMFITYLGPFLGIGLLIFLYHRIAVIFKRSLVDSRVKKNALLLSLCFAFLAVSLNALFHNAWLLTANGPTVFLYFSILHLSKQQLNEQNSF